MKRFITIGIVCLFAFSFVSCAAVPVTTTNDYANATNIEDLQKQVDELKKEDEKLKEEESIEEEPIEEEQPTDTDTSKGLLDAFINGEINAEGMHEGKEQFSIEDLTNVDEDWLKYTEKERKDVDNDGEDELIMDGPYGGMILDAKDGKVVILAEGEGTAGVLSYTDYDNAVWICHSDTSHGGREMFFYDKYNGEGEITDSMSLKAEYWDNSDDQYDENSIFSFNDEPITMREYEELKSELFPEIEEYNVGKEENSKSENPSNEDQQVSDGIYSASLWASKKELAGPTDAIIYRFLLEGNELYLFGTIDYKKDFEQLLPTLIPGDIHTFIIDENTSYGLSSGEADSEKLSRDEFFDYLQKALDSGLGIDIRVSNGVVTDATICS